MKHLLHKLSSMRLLMLLAVLLGMGSSAAWGQDLTFDFEDDGAHRSSGSNSYTGTNVYSQNDVSITLTYADAVTTGSPINGTANAMGRVAKNTTNSPTIVIGPINNEGYRITGISCQVNGPSTVSMAIHTSTDNSNWTSQQSPTPLTGATIGRSVSNLDITSSTVYLKFTLSVASTTSSNRDTKIDDIVITREAIAPASPLASIALSGEYPTTFLQGDAFSHEGMTVTATYDDTTTKDVTASAEFTGYDMSTTGNQTVTVSYTENEVTKTADYNITVNAPVSHNVTWSVNGETTVVPCNEGAAITFPEDPADVSGKTFVGWTTEAIAGSTNEPPTFVTSATMETSDVTYYAVFATVVGSASIVTDELTNETTGISGTSYSEWSGKEATSGAVYAGQSAGGNSSIQLRSNNNNSGVVTTTSGGKATKVVVVWNSNTSNGRTINIYGSNTAYSAATDLYGNNAGTLLGTIVCGTSTELTISDEYAYIGIRSASGALYLDKVKITWSTGGGVSYSDYCTTVVEATVARPTISVTSPFTLSTEVSMSCETDDATIYYTLDESDPTSESTEYTAPFNINATTTIKAIAIKGSDESEVTTVTATKNLAENTITVTGGTEQTIDLGDESEDQLELVATATNGATVVFTVDTENTTLIEDDDFLLEGNIVEIYTEDKTGVIVLKANADGDDNYATATEVTVTVNVINSKAPGSENNPYTVAQAIDAIDNGGNVTGVYVQGVISQIDSYASNYHSITYWISTDGTTTSTQFEVYSGKGLDGADFSSINDLEVGDQVVVTGDIKKYSDIYEFNYNNYIVSLTRKADSDFAISSETNVELEITSAELHPTSQITYTSSSTGDVIFVSNDDAVVTVSDEGIITAQGEGTTTITVMQDGDSNYKASAEMTINVTVTDNRSAVATDIDLPAAQKTLVVGVMDEFTPSSTIADGFTGTVEYTYETSDASIVNVVGDIYEAMATGTATITVTATPTGGNAVNYKSTSQEVLVTVKGTTTLELSDTEDIETFGTPIVFTATIADGYDGVLLTESSNDLVATAAIEGTTITVTSQAVGTAVITVTAPETEVFAGEVSKYFSVEFVQPAGLTEVSANGFTKVTATEDITDGEYLIVYEDGSVAFDGSQETLDAANNTIDVEINEGVIDANNDTKAATFTINTVAGTLQSKSGYYIGKETYANGLDSDTETQYTNTFEIDGAGDAIIKASGECVLKFNSASNQNRFRYYKSGQQDIQLYKLSNASETVTLNKYGYATYCSVNPMDFSETEGYTAWRVSGIASDGTITFSKITEAIKGGQGVLLYNVNANGESSNVTVNFANGTTEYSESENKLIGTTAPKFLEIGEVYGLKGSNFVINNADGVINAGKAYIKATDIPAEVKSFTFVFEDETTGITETRQATREEVESIFNLGGQRMSRVQRGINIVNGKKVFVR